MLLKNNLVMGAKVRRTYQNEFVKIGDTVSVRRPIEFSVTDGATLAEQDITEGKFTIQISKRKHVGMAFTTQDLTLTIDQFSERYLQPAIVQLAHQVDSDLTALYKNVWNWVGTPGQNIDAFSDFAKGPERLDLMAVPQNDRMAVLSPSDYWAFVGSQTALYAPNIVGQAYRSGDLGPVGNIETSMSQQVQTHTVGALGGTPLVNGASQNVTYAASKDTNHQNLVTDVWTITTGAIAAGDVFTIANVYSVNPRTKVSTGQLQNFVAVSAATADGSGNMTISISPAIITSGPYQTVNAAPADNAALTLKGTAATGYAQNLIFHRDAFQLVTVPLETDPSMGFAARATDEDTGLSIRIAKDYDITNDEILTRCDILYGVKALEPEKATRLSGTA